MDEPGVIQFVVVDSTECYGQVDFKLREVKKRWEPLTLLSSFKNITRGSTISKPNIQCYVAWQRSLQNAIKGVMKPNLFPPTFNQSVVLETKKWTRIHRLIFPVDHCSHDYVSYQGGRCRNESLNSVSWEFEHEKVRQGRKIVFSSAIKLCEQFPIAPAIQNCTLSLWKGMHRLILMCYTTQTSSNVLYVL